MALSDEDIKRLAEKADSCRDPIVPGGTRLTHLKEALKCYDQIIEHVTDHAYYFCERAKVNWELYWFYGLLKDKPYLKDMPYLNSAIHDLDEALKLEPGKGYYYRLRGLYRLSGIDDREETIAPQKAQQIRNDFDACVSRDPTQSKIWLDLLVFNIILQDWDEAISIYGQCKPYVDSKEDLLLRAYLGCLALASAGDPIEKEDIEPLYEPQIRFNPVDLPRLFLVSVGRFVEKEKNGKNKQKLHEINELLITHARSWFTKAVLFEELFGDYEKALEAYEKEIEIDPFFLKALVKKGVVCEKLNRYEEAIEAYDKAAKREPEYTTPLANKIVLLLARIGRFEEVKTLVSKWESHRHADKVRKAKLELFLAAKMVERSGNYKEALEICDKVIEEIPDYAWAWSKKALYLCNLKRNSEAVEAYEKYTELNTEDPAAWWMMAMFYLLNGNRDDAIGSLAKAIAIDSSYREKALKEEAFKSLWENKKFKKLISKLGGPLGSFRNLFEKGSNK